MESEVFTGATRTNDGHIRPGQKRKANHA